MILAINANAALDIVLFIDRWQPKTDMRTQKAIQCVGGKGLDTALVLKTLGAPLQAVTFIAGENGKTLARLLDERHIPTDFIWLPGETRISHVIVEQALHQVSHIATSGYTITPADFDRFLEKIEAYEVTAQWAVMAGSLPGGAPTSFFRQIIERLHQHQVKVLIDNTGAPLREALSVCPDIVKMNQSEFQSTFGVTANEIGEWTAVAHEQRAKYQIETLVITGGAQGILVFTPSASYHAQAPVVAEVNSAGAGDAVSAALSYRLMLGDSWPEALTWATAAGAAVAMTDGTAECNLSDVLNLRPQVQVKRLA